MKFYIGVFLENLSREYKTQSLKRTDRKDYWIHQLVGFLLGKSYVLCQVRTEFLGPFVKFRKATVSFVMFVCPPLRPSAWNNSILTGKTFVKFNIGVLFENCRQNSH